MTLTVLDIFAIAAIISALVCLMLMIKRVTASFGLSPEVARKLVHVATGLSALSFPFIFSGRFPVALLLGAGMLVMLALRAKKGIGSVLHTVERESYGEFYLAAAIGMLFFLADGQRILYILPLLIITLSDTASALVGTEYGRQRFIVEGGTKSVEGVLAFFVVTWLIALVALLLLSEVGRASAVILSFLLAAFCALVEADSWRGLDNLFVPAAAILLVAQHLESSPSELALFAVQLGTVLAGTHLLAPQFGLSKHSARAYAVLLFLVLLATAPINAILPSLAIIAHMWARGSMPATERNTDLDLIAASAAVGLAWLVFGGLLARTTIMNFNLTFAAAAMVFFFIGLKSMRRWAALPAGVLLAGLSFAIWKANSARAILLPEVNPTLIIAAFVVPLIVLFLVPAILKHRWTAHGFILAAIAPAISAFLFNSRF